MPSIRVEGFDPPANELVLEISCFRTLQWCFGFVDLVCLLRLVPIRTDQRKVKHKLSNVEGSISQNAKQREGSTNVYSVLIKKTRCSVMVILFVI